MITFFLIVAYVFMYYVIGFAGFVYWWTKEYDYDTSDISLSLFLGICGPFTWLLGWLIHTNRQFTIPRLIIRKKTLERKAKFKK